ncbi:hypothetical protein ZIOFF_050675 [Zingiber officinale]|uniref:dUTPase-like domain-containing protein n=1 Tax=Zingiber officinale TaxID=94328 RepID=A0A8J5KM78_ZINOF|nr:hypothetical protein ZIOFF_050675 [Zingiber officinale]
MITRKSFGAAGFDLAINTFYVIEPRGRTLTSTGLSLEIPWGTYGRIATRSSVTLKYGLDLLPREAATVLFEEESPLDDLDGNRAGTTSPWASVLRSTNLSLDTSEPEDDYLEHIQYFAAHTQPTPHSEPDAPIWDTYADDSDWVNPFTSEGGGGNQDLTKDFSTMKKGKGIIIESEEAEDAKAANMLYEETTERITAADKEDSSTVTKP